MKKLILTIVVIIIASLFLGSVSAHAQDKGTGTISGDIRIEGDLPKGKGPSIVEYQGPCGAKKSLSVISLWKDRVTDVVLWLTPLDIANGVHTDISNNVSIIGYKCEFWPKMTPARPGTVIAVANEDPYTQWLIVESSGEKKKQILQESGSKPIEIEVKEDIHVRLSSAFYPWMEAWINPVMGLVAKTQTDWDGRFSFNDIEPGKYVLHTWHSMLGETSQEVEVEFDEDTDVEVKYQLPEKNVPIIEATMLEELFGKPSEAKDNDPFK